MGHRLSRIVTRTGDDGTTGLADGSRVAKHAARITALGAVDELNSQIGVLRAEPLPDDVQGVLQAVQNDLFDLGGELAMPEYLQVGDGHILRLEQSVAVLNADLPALKEFILPGGTRAAALAHVCRTVCRRAERDLCVLHDQTPISANLLRYLNRLSDLLFILARVLNKRAGVAEPAWRGPASA
ncbi:MAG: cob(I)yrinic acid a,c-diamide adenosyltransferase [Hydrogenophilales bacterium]|nr:cob(I)yrinic acid a,c-diamide adenosyltransferase [Hydrogenophilales bacterium]